MTRAATRWMTLTCLLSLATGTPVFAQAKPEAGQQDKSATHDHGKSESDQDRPPFIPPLTDDDRKAAFPDVEGHAVHGDSVNYFVLFDQLEWQRTADDNGFNLDSRGWVGRDRDRLWFRAEGDGRSGRVGEAQAHLFYGRQIARWWDVVAGLRQDFRPGEAQAWAAVGLMGLAPYWFEIEATAYVGAEGRTQARLEVEYELRMTNRIILQPLIEMDIVGKADPARGIGAGISTTDAGFRLRYEWRREIAPYAGVTWTRKWGKTADFAEASGEDVGGARLVSGVRLWF
jgi:copper resistance protein B